MSKRRSSFAAAPEFASARPPRRWGWLGWLALLVGPTVGLVWMGDPITAAAYALLIGSIWMGYLVGGFRTLMWMLVPPLCVVAATAVGPRLAPHLPMMADPSPWRLPTAMAIVGVAVWLAAYFLISRPIRQFIWRRPGLGRFDAVVGGLISGVQAAAVVAMAILGIRLAQRDPSTAASLSIDPSKVRVASEHLERSRLGRWTDRLPIDDWTDRLELADWTRAAAGRVEEVRRRTFENQLRKLDLSDDLTPVSHPPRR